jgi:DNA modification methylase
VIYHEDRTLVVHQGDVIEVLKGFPAKSVHCVVTSPPYWGLRDYGTAEWEGGAADCEHKPDFQPRSERANTTGSGIGKSGYKGQEPIYRDTCGKCGARRVDAQLGMEPTPEEYVTHMVEVFREVRRALRDDGTVWLNLGDSYANDTKWGGSSGGKHVEALHGQTGIGRQKVTTGLKAKDLVGIPWRVAFALQADGWYLRSDIIWAKPNPMPESVTDRPTKSHEYVFLLSKRDRYYFDEAAVRENGVATDAHGQTGGGYGVTPPGQRPQQGSRGPMVVSTPIGTRNLRSVWTIATQPFPGAHFAVFPEALVEPCVKAGTSERGVCPECGAPWMRETERQGGERYATGKSAVKNGAGLATAFSGYTDGSSAPTFITTGWRPTCEHHDAKCEADPIGGHDWIAPATVLDPFGGSGTTALVAQRLGRRGVLIELAADNCEMAVRRAGREFGRGRVTEVRAKATPVDGGLWEDEPR